MTTFLLMIATACFTVAVMSLIYRKPNNIVALESEIDLLTEKNNALCSENGRLQNENTDILEKNYILKAVIRNLESDLQTAKDTGKLELIEEMEK